MPFEMFEEELQEVDERPFDGERFVRMMGYLRPYKRELVWMGLGILMATGVMLFEPYLLGMVVDKGITPGDVGMINRLAIALLLLHVLAWVGNTMRIRLMNVVGQGVLYDLRQELFDHIQKLSLRFYDQRPVGRIMSRITSDVNAIATLVNEGMVVIISQAVTVIGITIVMFWLSWRLSLLAFFTIPMLAIFFFSVRQRIETGWKNVRRTISNISANMNESINGIYVTQAFRREERNIQTFGRLTQTSHDAWMRTIRVEELIWPVVDFVGVFGTALVLIAGAWMVLRGQVTLGLILAFSGYLWRFWAPISSMSKVYGQALSAMASAERIFEFLDTEPEVADRPDAKAMPPILGDVEFDNVYFRYDPEQEMVLKKVNLHVKPGETIALVGPTGSGKSSIINLIMRFYDPVGGAVRIDGHDVRDVTLASLREQMAIVLQDSFLFSGTIADNIRYGNLDATDEAVERVAKAVHLDPYVQTLDDKYGHEVGERGGRLSVGQRQLVAFARALLADPRILILDEATSNVDTATERVIQKAMETLLEGRTAFIIAHRLSTIRHADRILVIEDGRIVEEGTHEALLAQGGRYLDLYLKQFVGRLPGVNTDVAPQELVA
ncbi:MAG: ABC transporter ATP-binding protein/permease [Chloroflexota bacterium]|nr:ABC transporter ATP-binding protein/permease [Chloroflexota bacterium]